MRSSIIILFSFISVLGVYAQNFERISKEILECHQNLQNKADCNRYYYNLREQTQLLKKLHSGLKCDTIYLMEYHGDITDRELNALIWNRSDTIYYEAEEFGKRKLSVDSKNYLFYNTMSSLVSRWDREGLAKEEELYSGMIPQSYVYATRIIINKKKYSIDCMYFKFFCNPERDWFIYEKN